MYRAPVAEIAHTLKNVAGLSAAIEEGRLGDLTEDLADAILEEAGRFAGEEIAPLYKAGDETGAVWDDGAVTTPPGWKELYARWIEAGWNALAGPAEYGGQNLPAMLSVAVLEMWNSGSMAFAVGPTLTFGAVEAIEKHASEELKRVYLGKLVSGEWMGTMNLTEPQAGSDLNALRTRAQPAGDGTYRIFGQKIFITYGEHDFTDNIVHLVLARLPDAPAGTRGISLFLVPKYLVNADGTLGARNDVHCASIEHKLGIHGSPTCTMIYGDGKFGETPGAVGWLVGEENKGLACMFTMMNNARLAIGIQGVAVAEAAYQKAKAYAGERRQGRAPGYADLRKSNSSPPARSLSSGLPKAGPVGATSPVEGEEVGESGALPPLDGEGPAEGRGWGGNGERSSPMGQGMSPIVEHPDVRRNLLTMMALTQAARAICYSCAHALDMARAAQGEERRHWQDRAGLLTPLAKAFSTDIGVEVASIGVQVHGGMGFIEETGAAALYRDARIAPIYEGTNGIQAIDLVTRKLPLSGGEHVHAYIGELRGEVEALRASNLPGFGHTAGHLERALGELEEATRFLQRAQADGRISEALAGATPYLRLFSLAAGAALMARGARVANAPAQTALCRFFAENLLPEASVLKDRVVNGAASLDEAAAAVLA